MIVDTMNYNEAATFIQNAFMAARPKIHNLNMSKMKVYGKIVRERGEKKVYFKPTKVDKFGLEFIVCPYSLGKSDYKKNGIYFFAFCKVFFKGELYWCFIDGKYNVSFYKKHLFLRYLERHCGVDTDIVTLDDVWRFFKETDCLYNCHDYKSEKHSNGIVAGTNIGTMCGDVVDDILVFRTFIDASTLVPNYKMLAYDLHPKDHELARAMASLCA